MNHPAAHESPTPAQIIAGAREAGRRGLDEPAAKRILAAYGLTVPRGVTWLPRTALDLDGIPAPFAAKMICPGLLHKSDAGGVKVGLSDAAEVLAAVRGFESLARTSGLRLEGVLVEEMAPPGVELVVGGVIDERFGPVLMLGMGGVYVELFRDTVFRVCPITRRDAETMIDALRGAPLLRGARGRAAVDESLIASALLAVGDEAGLLMDLQHQVAELDINPLIVSARGAYACDARILLSTTPESVPA